MKKNEAKQNYLDIFDADMSLLTIYSMGGCTQYSMQGTARNLNFTSCDFHKINQNDVEQLLKSFGKSK